MEHFSENKEGSYIKNARVDTMLPNSLGRQNKVYDYVDSDDSDEDIAPNVKIAEKAKWTPDDVYSSLPT